jgi:hypothetical protein
MTAPDANLSKLAPNTHEGEDDVKKTIKVVLMLCAPLCFLLAGCGDYAPTSDQKQQAQQEQILQEGTAQTGMPNIVHFRERKLLKDILELRDQDGLVTYSYLFSQYTGKLCFLGNTIGYPIPYATQYTSPSRVAHSGELTYSEGNVVLPQADPNALFTPPSAEGTWVMMVEPGTGKARPQYVEERVQAFTYELKGAARCY